MATIKLSKTNVDRLTCPPNQKQVFLREAGGFGVRATANSKAYIFQGKLDGKVIRMTIGDVETWFLDEARKEARRLKTIIDSGRDPRVIRDEAMAADAAKREKAKQEETPALEAWAAYIQARAPKWSERHKADHETMSRQGGEIITRGRRQGMPDKKEPGILRPLLELPLKQITRDQVAAWLEVEAAKRATRARLAVSLLATFINWCSDRPEYREQVNADACIRMKKDLPKPAAKDDVLQREQLALWFEHVRRIRNPVQAAYLQTVLLIGARREEVATMRWEDVDFKWLSITIHDKVEGERTIPLTPYVKSLLLNLKRLNDLPTVVNINGEKQEPSPWVFSSPTAKNGYITEPRIAHNRAIQAAGLPHLTIHGLRRSFGTLAEWVECPAGIAAQIQGHKPSATAEKHYIRRPLDLLRMWHTKIEGWILEQAGIEQPREEAPRLKAVNGGMK
ncbi:prophage integrase IntF [Advenella faeciporci]|uniref:Prophage integrase IntF n=1 Tax=Advenella faeciporci TaxID=797535 RepID=A0A918JE16_9BURK|nr:integrase family protein [Advenella faeciporci]GGW76273.1 prophage integrase IntF [Advenella faeciporci]